MNWNDSGRNVPYAKFTDYLQTSYSVKTLGFVVIPAQTVKGIHSGHPQAVVHVMTVPTPRTVDGGLTATTVAYATTSATNKT